MLLGNFTVLHPRFFQTNKLCLNYYKKQNTEWLERNL